MEEHESPFYYEDLVEPPKPRKPILRWILIILLVLVLVGAGVFAYLNQMIPFLPAAGQNLAEAPQSPQEGEVMTAAVGATAPEPPAALEPTLTPTATQESAPPEEETVVVVKDPFLPAPPFGEVVFTRAAPQDDWAERAQKMAGNMAIAEPYDWEFYSYTPETRLADLRAYYVELLTRQMGYRLTFEETFAEQGFTIYKFKQESRRVTIQFWEKQFDSPPRGILFYEGW